MMSFKQYLQEEGDVVHKVEEAAAVFLEHCKQWKDIDHPLYRLSAPVDGSSASLHKPRTRSPRLRRNESLAGTRQIQKMIFDQAGWERFPDRLHSIFCSTQKKFEVGEVDDHSDNLLMIYPFDGVTMGSTTDVRDFNYINLMKGHSKQPQSMMHFDSYVRSFLLDVTEQPIPYDQTFTQSLLKLKDIFIKNGKFDPDCNGNRAYAKNIENNREEWWEELRVIVTKIPKMWTPELLGIELVTPASIDLPGNIREVWFSGKYLSIPAFYHRSFVQTVQALQKGEEPPSPKKKISVRAVKVKT